MQTSALTRDAAIALLARLELMTLSPERRHSIAQDFWVLDSGDSEFHELPERIQKALGVSDYAPDVVGPEFDELLLVGLKYAYGGATSSYLSAKLHRMCGHEIAVLGDPEPMFACECCGYRSLRRRGEYDICNVCFWEDDGTCADDRHSGPNRLTLGEARRNFAEQVRRLADSPTADSSLPPKYLTRDGR